MSSRRRVLPAFLALTTGAVLLGAPCVGLAGPTMTAAEGYTYGYPLVLMAETRDKATGPDRICGFDSDINTFKHLYDVPDEDFRAVVRPNVDTLYSSAFLDLSEGPVVLTMPSTDDRYVLLALVDAWSNNFAGLGTPSHGTAGGTYVIAGPDWDGELPDDLDLPEGAKTVSAPTDLVWIIGRTEVRDADDVEDANAVQDGFELEPTASSTSTGDGTCTDRADAVPPPDAVAALTGVAFMERLDALLEEQQAPAADDPMLEDLASIGVGPYATSSVEDQSAARKWAINKGTDLARSTIEASVGAMALSGGWSPDPTTVELGEYGTDYLIRAVVAQVGFGANKQEFAVYQNTATDSRSRDLDGEYAYSMTFAAGETPPVGAFWSITAYDEAGYLTANDIDRFALGSNSDLVLAEDGSLTLVFAHELPEGVSSANWLPVPDAPFELTLRMYEPDDAILEGDWTAPDVVRD